MLQAIQTSYKGYRFRSRLEARWAVFFDTLGARWEYEPEGFVLPGGQMYLPDFRVRTTAGPRYYEVKPSKGGDTAKVDAFNSAMHDAWVASGYTEHYFSCVVLQGDPVDVLEPFYRAPGTYVMCPRCGAIGRPACDINYWDMVSLGCESCDFTTPDGGGNPGEECLVPGMLAFPHKGFIQFFYSDWNTFCALVKRAAIAARSARFEHGASG